MKKEKEEEVEEETAPKSASAFLDAAAAAAVASGAAEPPVNSPPAQAVGPPRAGADEEAAAEEEPLPDAEAAEAVKLEAAAPPAEAMELGGTWRVGLVRTQLSSLAQMSSEATAVINPFPSVITWLIVPDDMDKLLIVSGLLCLDIKYDN